MARNRGADESPPSTDRRSTAGLRSRLQGSWLGRNWHTVVILAAILFIAFFVRTYFGYSISVDNGYLVSGGSDSYYHERVIDYVMSTGEHLVIDPMLNYPNEMRNARPPLYDWSVAVSASLLSGFGVDSVDATGFALVMSTAFWGALTIIPVYLMGRAAFGNKAGLVAALLFAVMAGHIQRSVMSNADHDAMVLFFTVCSFYFILLALMNIRGDKWVSKWRDMGAIRSGFREYLSMNQRSLLFAMLSGVMLAAVAMIWTGFAYLVVIILAYLLVQVLVNRFRDVDSMGVVLTVGVMLLSALLIMAPVYYQMNYWDTWFDIPFYMFLAAMVFGAYFMATRDLPWTLSIPVFAVIAGIVLFGLSIVMPSLFEAIVTGQGYFIQSKLYATISEAQAPDFSNLVLSFGVVTFWLSFSGVVYAAYKILKDTSPYLIFIVVWSGVSMFMAVSAGRFLFNAAPAFAITAGWMTAVIIDRIDFHEIPKALSSFKGNPMAGLRKAINLRHVLGALFLAFLILLPNVWFAVDAGIPANSKAEYSQEVYDVMPNFLKPSDYDVKNGTSWYFGAFSYSLPLPTTYWPAAWSWFAQQDADIYPDASKPAFLSWWDYGFEAVQEGQHPTVADNFQNAYQYAGQFITCQGEDQAIAMLITRTLDNTGVSDNQTIVTILERYDVDVDAVNNIMTHPSDYIQVVKDNPDTYGPYDSELSAQNAKYAVMQVELAKIGSTNLVDLYHDLRVETGIDVGYFAIDGRLFPFTAFGYNIFYAPASLSDHRIDQYGQPIDFYQILAVDQYGEYHTFENVTQDMVIVDYAIDYKEMFYDCMLYKTFMGYSPSDIGYEEQGIPGISGSLASLPPMQGWNLSHFKMVYRTVYFNPFPVDQIADHTDAWRAISLEEGLELQEKIDAGEIDGYVDFSASNLQSGVVFVQYYEGAIISGTATTESGQPFANAWVTVVDEYEIPHMTVKTDENGYYEVLAPFGEVQVVYSYGDLDLRTQVAGELKRVSYNITYSQAMRAEVDSDSDGIWDYYFDGDVVLQSSDIDGTVFWDMNGDGEYNPTTDQPITDASVVLEGTSLTFQQEVVVDSAGHYLFEAVPPMDADLYAFVEDRQLGLTQQVIKPLGDRTVDIPVAPCGVNGTLVQENGQPVEGMIVQMEDLISGEVTNKTTDENGEFQFSMLLPGNYSLSLENTSLSIGEQVFNLKNSTVEREFTIREAMTISGVTRVNGVVSSNIMVGFYSSETEAWAISDSTGHFTIILPKDDYTVYSVTVKSGVQYAWLGQVTALDQVIVNPDLGVANIVTGTVTGGGMTAEDTDVRFESRTTGATITVVTNDTGGFRVALPTDDYFVYAHTDTHAIWQDVYIQSSKYLDLILGEAVHLSGMVWTDSDHNGLEGAHEGLDGVTIFVQDMDGRDITSNTNATGDYLVTLSPGNTYYVSFDKQGYEIVTREYKPLMESVTEDIELIPQNRTVQGTTLFGGVDVDDIEVQFIAAGGGAVNATATSDVHGNFEVSLAPGQYDIVVDQDLTFGDNSTKWQNSTTLEVVIGEDPEPLELDIVQRVRVYGTLTPDRGVSTDMVFDGPERIEIRTDETFDLYLIPGEYDIYAEEEKLDRYYAYLERMIIDDSSSPLTIETVDALSIEASLVYDEMPFLNPTPVSIINQTGETLNLVTDAAGGFYTYLPEGMYTIEVDYSTIERVDQEQRYLRYTASMPISLNEDLREDVSLDREYDNSTVSGFLISTTGHAVAGSLDFVAISETAIDSIVTVTEGGYTVELAPGEYTIYARQFEGGEAYMGTVEIVPYEPNDLTIHLETGLRFSGKTIYSGSQGPASIVITGDGSIAIESGIDGSYEIYLPSGSYSVDSSASTVEREKEIDYQLSFDLELDQGISKTLELEKVLETGVDVLWDDQEKATLLPGETAVYTVTLVNTGNVRDIYNLEALYTDWDVEFSQDDVTIDFGIQNSATVTMTISTPDDAMVDHDEITVYARSTVETSTSGTTNVDVTILPVRDVNMSFDKGYPTSGTNYSFAVRLTNQGNIDDTYTVSVANGEQLASLGWTYQFANETGDHIEIEVEAGSPAYFDMYLIPTRSNPDPDVELVLFVRSQSEESVQGALPVMLNLPEVTVPDLSVTGVSVYDSAPAIPNGTIFLGGLVLVLFVVMILLGFQKGVFRRRKR